MVRILFSLLIGTFWFAPVAFAHEIEVWGRTYDYSCGYFSRRAADLSFTLRDIQFAWGTQVKVIVGFRDSRRVGPGSPYIKDWQERVEIPAAVIDKGTWEAKILDKTLHHRTEARFLEASQFVFEIKEPGVAPRYLNGGTTWGYYETELLTPGSDCVGGGRLPPWHRLQYSSVRKN